MKKIVLLAAMCVCAIVLAGCGSGGQSQEASSVLSSAAASSAPAATSATTATTSTAPTATTTAPAQGTVTINWTEVATAEEAAKGAGLASFGVQDNLVIGDLVFEAPKFAYAGGVAQATYETPATMFTVRKATSTHSAPLTDRDTASFPQTWKETVDGTELTLYGPAEGQATLLTWNDGPQSYGVTFQGLGGEEMTMDANTVLSIVNGIKSVNVAPASGAATQESTQSQTQGTQASSSSTQNAAQGGTQNADAQSTARISADVASSIALGDMNAGVPDETTVDLVTGGDAPHYVVNLRFGNEVYSYEIDANSGDIWSQGLFYFEDTSGTGTDGNVYGVLQLSENEAVAIVQNMTGGNYAGSSYVETSSYGPCWYVAVTDELGNQYAYYVDGAGNAYGA